MVYDTSEHTRPFRSSQSSPRSDPPPLETRPQPVSLLPRFNDRLLRQIGLARFSLVYPPFIHRNSRLSFFLMLLRGCSPTSPIPYTRQITPPSHQYLVS